MQEAALAAVSAEVALALRRQSTGHASADSSSTLLSLLSSLTEPSSTAAGQHHSVSGPPATTSRRSSAEKVRPLRQASLAWLVLGFLSNGVDICSLGVTMTGFF